MTTLFHGPDTTTTVVFSIIWILFVVCVGYAMFATLRAPSALGPAPAAKPNFTYVSTSIAAIVLSIASGVTGIKISQTNTDPASQQALKELSSNVEGGKSGTVDAGLTTPQKSAWQYCFTLTYLITGGVCLLLFIFETPSPTHDLIKSVALSALGFFVSFATRKL